MSRSHLVVIAPLAFALTLFVLAALIERHRESFDRSRWRPRAYALALGVYCTSWTYFGAVGTAATSGWNYLPIYLGPLAVFLFAPSLLQRLASAVRAEGATSISDFIGSRFGKSRGVAALVTITAILGIVPYIALQLRSVNAAYAVMSGEQERLAPMAIAALLFGCFALVFGTRRYDAAARNEGLLVATGVESLLKLIAFGSVGVFALILLIGADPGARETAWAELARAFAPRQIGIGFLVVTGIAMAAILCLPRQFYIGLIEARGEHDLLHARWTFIAYIAVMVAIVPPITAAGLATLPDTVAPDVYVLALPLGHGATLLALFALVGGIAAATGMIVVETIALATMASNDLVAPLMLHHSRWQTEDFGGRILMVRRLAIVAIVSAAFCWALGVRADERLASIGQIAFAAMAQIAPLLLSAIRKPNNDAAAAMAALASGLAIWLYTLALPPVMPASWLAALGDTLFDPHRLLLIGHAEPLVHGVLWSLGINLAVFAIVAARRVHPAITMPIASARPGSIRDMRALIEFTGRFAGRESAVQAFAEADPLAPVGLREIRRAERLIAGVIGSPSARSLMASAIEGASLSYEDAASLLDASGQSLQFSKDLLAATLENIDPGVSVIDRDLRLIAWNGRYIELFGYPMDMVRVGAPVADLIRFNAERGDCGPGEVGVHVERRLDHLRRGAAHAFERRRYDGRVLKIVGGPMPGGGYVTCFTDITAEAHAREQLLRSRAELESRVAQRTAELTTVNRRLANADREKTRFLAAASHDLLQPLHAARLFGAALRRELDDRAGAVADKMDQSIVAAEQLLRALLDISKLDAGGIKPVPQKIDLSDFLAHKIGRFEPLAAKKGLELRRGPIAGTVFSDPALLRSIVQNFLSNAVRYTAKGTILIGTRTRYRAGVREVGVSVVDTGCGIDPADQQRVFREFERLDAASEPGVGLGLAIAERTARLIGGSIALRSQPGRGSSFTIWLPRDTAEVQVPRENPPQSVTRRQKQKEVVLVVDDDPAVLDATAALLEGLGHIVRRCSGAAWALAESGGADVALVDYRLGPGEDGLDLIERLGTLHPGLRLALVTSEADPELSARARSLGATFMLKPVAGATIEAFVAGSSLSQTPA